MKINARNTFTLASSVLPNLVCRLFLKAVGKHDSSKLLLETSFLGVQAPNSPNYKKTQD
jgi:hypothetical protein